MLYRAFIRLFVVIILAVIILPVQTRADALEPVFATANGDMTIRSGPGTDFPRVGMLAKDLKVQLNGRSLDGWYRFRIRNLGIDGWLAGSLITIEGHIGNLPLVSESAPSTTAQCPCPGTAPTPVNAAPAVPGTVPDLNTSGQGGASAQVTGSNQTVSQAVAAGQVVATALTDVIIRGGPGNQYEDLGIMPAGSSLILDGRTAGWYRFSFANSVTKGWLPARQVSISGDVNRLPDVTYPPY